MRYWFAFIALLVLVSCTPADPTGYVIAPPVADGEVLVTAQVLDRERSPRPVRVRVKGDLVADYVFVGDERARLSGDAVADGWLRGRGTAVLWLEPGEYRVVGYSCQEALTGYRCGCEGGSCGNWVGRSVVVP